MLTAEDVQNDLRENPDSQIQLSPIAASLLATLLNAWIFEGQDDRRDFRTERATDFVRRELPAILTALLEESPQFGRRRRQQEISAIDIIHWMQPNWPRSVKESEIMAFIFNKE